jgi:pimeloyl-ACP methyl ester carboxylesterase/DNA-binding CsgD family transcriptional regulator
MDMFSRLGWRLITFDGRGMGLSDRSDTDFSLKARLKDLEAVVKALAIRSFVLFGFSLSGFASIAYAAEHPERVSHLILSDTFASGAEYYASVPQMRALRALGEAAPGEWDFFLFTLANAATKFSDAPEARQRVELMRAAMTPEAFFAFRAASREIDVTPLLGSVTVPTLVLHTGFAFASLALARQLAAGIPNARLVVSSDWDETIVRAVSEFLDVRQPSAPGGAANRAALEQIPAGGEPGNPDHLTAREVEVLRLIATGQTNREISQELVLSPRTVARHITNIYGKIGAHNKVDATAYAIRHHLTPD